MAENLYNKFCSSANIAGLCNGSTADSDSVCEGSNPSPAAKQAARPKGRAVLFCGENWVAVR